MNQEVNKYFSPVCCPECKKVFYFVLKVASPELSQPLTLADIEKFKSQAKTAAEHITDKKEKKAFLESIDDPATILDEEEVNKIISQI